MTLAGAIERWLNETHPDQTESDAGLLLGAALVELQRLGSAVEFDPAILEGTND